MIIREELATGKKSEIAIFARILGNGKRQMAPSLARYVLGLGFDDKDQARMTDLAQRNQESLLSPDERDELMNFVKAGHLLALLQSRARLSLKGN